jgi:isopropylmalate/homocitrate/citramalate synthase
VEDQRADLGQWLSRLGVDLGEAGFERAFARMKEISDRSGAISEDQLRSIVDEAVSGMEVLDEVAASYK